MRFFVILFLTLKQSPQQNEKTHTSSWTCNRLLHFKRKRRSRCRVHYYVAKLCFSHAYIVGCNFSPSEYKLLNFSLQWPYSFLPFKVYAHFWHDNKRNIFYLSILGKNLNKFIYTIIYKMVENSFYIVMAPGWAMLVTHVCVAACVSIWHLLLASLILFLIKQYCIPLYSHRWFLQNLAYVTVLII